MELNKKQLNFNEAKEKIIDSLEKREVELQNEWLHNSDKFLSITNSFGEGSLESFKSSQRKNRTFFRAILRVFLSKIANTVTGVRFRDQNTLKELKKIERRKEEIAEAKQYFREIEDSEEDYQRNRAKELLPWSEQIVSYSLQVLPFKKHKEIEEQKRKDPYLQALHWYAFFISVVLTGGLILFYLIYKKSRNPRYKFLESPLSKHVLEQKKFEACLSEIIRSKTNFDSLANLKYCFSNTFSDLAYNSSIETRLMRSPLFKSLFLLFMAIITAGFLPMYLYILSSGFKQENFYRWWMRRKNIEGERIEELGNISRRWWGRGVKFLRKLWSDVHFTSYVAGLTNSIIARNFFSVGLKSRNLNYFIFWMYLTPRPRWFINLLLLIMSFIFFTVWMSMNVGQSSLTHWSFPLFVASFSLCILLFGYHILQVI